MNSISRYKRDFFLFILLIGFWLVLSPKVTLQSVLIGSIASLIIVIHSRDVSFKNEEMPLYNFSKLMIFFQFMLRLLVEIVKANIDVALIVLNPKLPIKPSFIKVPLKLNNDVNKVIYANAVTLTPGTLTIDIDNDGFIIHALTESAAKDMENSIIEKYAKKLEDK